MRRGLAAQEHGEVLGDRRERMAGRLAEGAPVERVDELEHADAALLDLDGSDERGPRIAEARVPLGRRRVGSVLDRHRPAADEAEADEGVVLRRRATARPRANAGPARRRRRSRRARRRGAARAPRAREGAASPSPRRSSRPRPASRRTTRSRSAENTVSAISGWDARRRCLAAAVSRVPVRAGAAGPSNAAGARRRRGPRGRRCAAWDEVRCRSGCSSAAPTAPSTRRSIRGWGRGEGGVAARPMERRHEREGRGGGSHAREEEQAAFPRSRAPRKHATPRISRFAPTVPPVRPAGRRWIASEPAIRCTFSAGRRPRRASIFCSRSCAALLPVAGLALSGRDTSDSGWRVAEELVAARVDEVPGAHVARLLLHPDDGRALAVRRERLRERVAQRVVLLEPDDGDVVALARLRRSAARS